MYKEVPDIQDAEAFKVKGNKKATVIYIEEVDGRHVLVVAVRGTVTKDDWMLNVNSTPKKSSQVSLCNTKPAMCYTNQQKLLDGTAMWHGGFLLVASTMENQTAKAISKAKNGNDCIDSLLFTGHSTGGAIAQIFYAMSMSSNTALSRAVSGESLRNVYYRETTLIGQKGIGEIHCVTFGTPPVASTALH